jgi:hypothetical protein
MKLCVLGNSHVGALKIAWSKSMASHPHLDLSFFAAPGTGFSKVQLEGERLVPTTERLKELFEYTSGGFDSIDIKSYDAFLVYGLGLSIPRRRADDRRYSNAVVSASYLDVLMKSLNLQMCYLLRSVTQAPIYVGHNPIPSIGEVSENPVESVRVATLSYMEAFELISRILLGQGMRLIAQPNETFLKDWMTNPHYCIGSLKLDVGKRDSSDFHDLDDVIHMNEEFGQVWLDSFLKMLLP